MTRAAADGQRSLARRGVLLEAITLGWNIVGVVLLAVLAVRATSIALLAFGLDSLIEIGASIVVIWELTGTEERNRRIAMRLIGWAFLVLAVYLTVQTVAALIIGHRSSPLLGGVAWTGATAAVMFALAWGKARVGRALDDPVLRTEGRVTLIDGVLATTILAGLLLDAAFGWWWADPVAALVVAVYAAREASLVLRG